jgi:ATP-dependent helicase/nuclease subunit A
MAAAAAAQDFDGFRPHTTSSVDVGLVATLPPIPRDGAMAGQESAAAGTWRDSLTAPREVPEETLRTLEARQVARWIASRVNGGMAARAVMVLSRRRAGLLPVQIELRALGVAAQIGEKTALIDCCEVQDVVALLDVLVSPQHDLSLARVLKSPLFGLPDDALVDLSLRDPGRQTAWFDLLQQPWPADSAFASVGASLLRWRQWVRALPPHDALQSIYNDGDVLARFAMAAPATQRAAVLANLRALLEATLQVAGGRYATPYAFVRALKAGGVQAPAALVEDAVRLLTIHGAKGLEADAVVLLDTDTPERAADTMGALIDWPGHAARPARLVFLASERRPPACAADLLEVERGQRRREELNALYVALTRARDTLMVSSIEPHRDAPDSWWRRLSAAVDLRLEAPVDPAACASGAMQPDTCAIKELPLFVVPPADVQAGTLLEPDDVDDETLQARVGKAMHRLLEWGGFAPSQLAAVVREFVLSPDQAGQAATMARRIRAGEGAWVWDTAVVDWQGSEVDLVHRGQLLRLDRLVRRRDNGQWWVLDFKSARDPERQPQLVAQLQAYRSAVQAIYSQSTVCAAFLNAEGAMIKLADDPL